MSVSLTVILNELTPNKSTHEVNASLPKLMLNSSHCNYSTYSSSCSVLLLQLGTYTKYALVITGQSIAFHRFKCNGSSLFVSCFSFFCSLPPPPVNMWLASLLELEANACKLPKLKLCKEAPKYAPARACPDESDERQPSTKAASVRWFRFKSVMSREWKFARKPRSWKAEPLSYSLSHNLGILETLFI